jgi:hypothetical protein
MPWTTCPHGVLATALEACACALSAATTAAVAGPDDCGASLFFADDTAA